jgi:flagellar protein FliJ
MARFHFRLHKVLEYRELQEEWAKTAYLEAQRERLQGDAELARICQKRTDILAHPVLSIGDRLAIERMLFVVDDLEHQQRIVLQVLMGEEAEALLHWQEKKRDAEVLRKLKEKAYSEWEIEQSRREQAELDEWAVLRRAA